jgi:oxalate decarboxylase/phosphoglucose isomerase-like protein (cupin superfamily)
MLNKSLAAIAVVSLLISSAAAMSNMVLANIAPQSAQEAELADTDFVFDLAQSSPVASGDGGSLRVMSGTQLKALRLSNGAGGGGGVQVFADFAPCGFRTPHIHPRGTENFFVISGMVKALLLRENGGGLISNNITAGFSGFFGEGQLHFLQNVGCENAKVIAMFDNNDPGTVNAAAALRFPTDTLEGTFGNSELVPNDDVIGNILVQSRACLKRCGLHEQEVKMYINDE